MGSLTGWSTSTCSGAGYLGLRCCVRTDTPPPITDSRLEYDMVHGSRARGQWSVCHWPGLQMKDKPLSVAQVGHPTELVQRLGREQRLDERRRRGEGPEGEVMDLSE